jgi:hypothetical protein
MPAISWRGPLVVSKVDGTANTAGTAATSIPPAAKITLPPGFFTIGKAYKVTAAGRISCVVTTPGTARYDLRIGSVVAFDSGALNLNVVAKTNVPWLLEVWLTCRAEGNSTLANLMGQGRWTSEAVVGSAANTAGGNGSLLCPVGAPAVGTGFDSTVSQTLDMFFTQTVGTGSMTVHQYIVEDLNGGGV